LLWFAFDDYGVVFTPNQIKFLIQTKLAFRAARIDLQMSGQKKTTKKT
jgi:hypothetical protein